MNAGIRRYFSAIALSLLKPLLKSVGQRIKEILPVDKSRFISSPIN